MQESLAVKEKVVQRGAPSAQQASTNTDSIYWYKSTNTDGGILLRSRGRRHRPPSPRQPPLPLPLSPPRHPRPPHLPLRNTNSFSHTLHTLIPTFFFLRVRANGILRFTYTRSFFFYRHSFFFLSQSILLPPPPTPPLSPLLHPPTPLLTH